MVYCLGCNERFGKLHDNGLCPRCGALIEAIDGGSALDRTLQIRDNQPPSFDSLTGHFSHHQDCQDELIGKELHIYRCDSLLGRGGMGRVYLARHNALDRFCALKVLSSEVLSHDIDWVDRFQQEGRAAAALSHPNIVTTHAIGEVSGVHFLEMEFVPGRSLQTLIDDERRLTPVRSTQLMIQIADGLSTAHRHGIVHRDLKPDNVLLNQNGVAKIGDFGLAKRVAANEAQAREPMFGTPYFMAPELFQGSEATTASDVYALGVCYYLLLTGKLPYVCNSFKELRQKVVDEPFPSVRRVCPDIPLEMAECLSLMMAKSPNVRPENAIEAFQLLLAISGQVRDIDSLLREAFPDGSKVTWTRTGSIYQLAVNLPNQRQQKILVEPSDHSTVDRLLLLYTVCCPAQPSYYEAALTLNSKLLHGSISVRDVDGTLNFVMGDTYPRSTVDAEEIRRSVMEIAFHADAVEKELTGLDRN